MQQRVGVNYLWKPTLRDMSFYHVPWSQFKSEMMCIWGQADQFPVLQLQKYSAVMSMQLKFTSQPTAYRLKNILFLGFDLAGADRYYCKCENLSSTVRIPHAEGNISRIEELRLGSNIFWVATLQHLPEVTKCQQQASIQCTCTRPKLTRENIMNTDSLNSGA